MKLHQGEPQTLSVSDLAVRYGGVSAVRSVSFTIEPGQSLGLIGANGAGKTSTLRALMGLVPRAAGELRFGDRDLSKIAARDMVRLGIGYVPEDRRIFPLLTVTENLRTGLDRHGVTTARKKELLDKSYGYFPVLAERRNQFGGTLSGGEQQMLAIARAMMLEPKIILLDEPTEGLMPRMVSQIRDIIGVLHRDGVAVLLVEQNVPLTLDAGQRIYIIEKGVVRHHAPAADLRADDAPIHRYMGV